MNIQNAIETARAFQAWRTYDGEAPLTGETPDDAPKMPPTKQITQAIDTLIKFAETNLFARWKND